MERIALDVHAHLVPVEADRLASITGARWNSELGVMEIDGHRTGVPALYQPQALIAWMEQHRVEHAWISIPPPLYRQQLAGDGASQWAGYLNDGLQKICERFPKQLSPLFHLPVEHPELAAQEAARRIAAGARTFSMAAGGPGTPVYSDPALEPLWTALDAAGSFLFLHPGTCCDGRLKAFYLENLVGNPYETAVAAAHLVFGGVCERFTQLRFCLAHGGGATAMLAGRLQHGFETGRQGIVTSREAPRTALARFHADSIVHDNTALAFVANTFGEDGIVFGSDWPFPMGVLEPHRKIGSLPDPLRRKVFWDNPYNLRQQYAWRPDQDGDTPSA
ncbi:MAG TPA: amidohydrolase family protein [Ramlibacter sp.]|nr:amidohydrolase family protein [Ramlibacter sp.]